MVMSSFENKCGNGGETFGALEEAVATIVDCGMLVFVRTEPVEKDSLLDTAPLVR